MERWLQQHLTDIGAWNADGVGRKARVTRHGCGARIAAGLDSDRGGLRAVADLAALTPLGEALALIDGRTTYALRGRLRLELDRRDSFHVAGSPAGSRDYPVLPEHRCGSPPPDSTPIELTKTTTTDLGDTPPF